MRNFSLLLAFFAVGSGGIPLMCRQQPPSPDPASQEVSPADSDRRNSAVDQSLGEPATSDEHASSVTP